MRIQIVFLEGLKSFSKSEKNTIKRTITSVSKDAGRLLGIKSPVIFTVFKSGKIVNGYTTAHDWIRLTMPENKFSIKELQANVYHELNHVARGYSEAENFKNGISLLETIVAEGLGTYFEMQKVKGLPFTHGRYDLKELKKVFKELKKNLNNKNYNYFEWFFGEGNKPKSFGYKMGKYIIDQVMLHNPKLNIKELTRMPAEKIWKLSKVVL